MFEATDNHIKISDEVNPLFKDLHKNAPYKLKIRIDPSPRLLGQSNSNTDYEPGSPNLSPSPEKPLTPRRGLSDRNMDKAVPLQLLQRFRRLNTFHHPAG